jgi:hypothetical protein
MDGVEVGSPRLQRPQKALIRCESLAIDYKQSAWRRQLIHEVKNKLPGGTR